MPRRVEVRRLALVPFAACVVACGRAERQQKPAPPDSALAGLPDSMLVQAPDSETYAATPDDSAAARTSQRLIDSLGHGWPGDSAARRSYSRSATGLVPVAGGERETYGDVDAGADAAGEIIVVHVAHERPDAVLSPSLRYYFDRTGQTVAVQRSYTDTQNGCAESVSVTETWLLRAGRVVAARRELRDQDGYDLSPAGCHIGAGDSATLYTTRAALARSIGLRLAPAHGRVKAP